MKKNKNSFSFRRGSLKQKKSSASLAETASGWGSQANLLNDVLYSPQVVQIGHQANGPTDNITALLAQSNDPPKPMLFCEMLHLVGSNFSDQELQPHWNQTNRWIKYEQTVEGEGSRFSKPHLTFMRVPSLLQVRNTLKRGLVLLDVDVENFPSLVELITDSWCDRGALDEAMVESVRMLLFAPKLYSGMGKRRRVEELVQSESRLRSSTSSSISNVVRKLSSSPMDSENSKLSPRDSFDELQQRPSSPKPDDEDSFIRKLAPGTEAAVIMVANVEGLEKPLSAFVRLTTAQILNPDIPQHAIPVKFVFILLNRAENFINETSNLGRTVGALFSDEIFSRVAYLASDKHMLCDAADEFFTTACLLPAGKCTPETRCHPEDLSSSLGGEFREVRKIGLSREDIQETSPPGGHANDIVVSGTLFGGLAHDIQRKLPWYASDFTDFFRGRLSQSFAATICVFFANLTNIITFGAVMERTFNGEMAAVENILCGAITGVIFGLFSGQPLNVLSATGPTLIFEKIIYDMCKTQGWDFLPFRFWMACWIALILLVIVAKDLSALVAFITRFTEEAFATLISVVFIIQAAEKILEIQKEAPLTPNPGEFIDSTCQCIRNASRSILSTHNLYSEAEVCTQSGGTLSGKACFFKPDVFLASVLLALGTYAVAMKLHSFKQSPYLNTMIRNIVADFGLLISIIIFSLISYLIGIRVPILQVPQSLTPTMKRPWLVDITNISSPTVIFVSAVPAVMYTILIVMDQQITAVIVNRKDNLLKKGGGYHLDLFILAPLIILCALLGLPFYVAATVLSMAHLDALKQQSVSSAPGDPPRYLGIKEQRLSTIFAHILIGFSLFLTPILRLVPLPVLTGIFLYMGVVSLGGQQFVQRFQLLFMSSKTQPEYHWLRSVRMKRTHLFTFIQLVCVLALFGLKNLKGLKMTFPLMLLVMVIVRAFLLERMFTQTELRALDDRLPTWREVMTPKDKKSSFPGTDRSEEPLTSSA
ncbi:unnamed protein product [Bursaphelenchus xylophilus]|uniref:Anion exchange protein n=1 Tax=Bursaphelenchus xylophilus TaxID=6326 RepID=A0A7I8X9J6_BURXY|nr:unnamed protein product [Bursaphelenchus xylophilus]CAG9132097.1 unnamed protein product [Bursaphelenchus xylophilus]